MPTFENTPRGTVVSIWGKAYIRGTDGVWRPLKLGEVVKPGDALLTEQNAIVQMSDGKGEPVALGAVTNQEAERAITALEQGDREAAPAAGLAGGDGGDLQPGLRVERVVESVTATGAAERLDAPTLVAGVATQSNPPESSDPVQLVAPSSSIGALESGAPVGLGLTSPTGGASLVVTVTQVPAIGQIVRTDGTPVAAGSTLAPSDLAGLRYVPPADYDGAAPVGDFGFTVSNGTSSAAGGTQIALTPVNDAPLATAGSANGAEDAVLGVSLVGTDIDGTIASVSVTSLPANGTLLLADGATAVIANQALTPAQAAGLLFRPDADFNGSASLSFSVTDNGGLASSPAAFAITVSPVNDTPVAVDDTVSTVGTVPVTLAVLANDVDGDGDPVAVSGASVDAALGSVVVNADGSLSFTAAAGVSGPVVVTYTVADPGGATDSATLTINVAAAPTVTVDAPALTNDSTPAITGTTNLPPGSTVTLSVTDANGAVQAFTATVLPDGSYTTSVPGALADGSYSVSATVSVSGGASATANDGGSVDTAVPTITVDAPALGNDNTPTISGSTDLPAGATIALTVTGADGAVQTFTATVQPGGGFSADVPAALVDGGYSVVALGTDAAGNTGSASDSGVVDTTPPALSVDVPALGNDSTPTISGTTDLPAGSTVTLSVTDANGAVQTFNATVQAGGGYGADVPSALAEGPYTVVATASDAAGNTASASDSGMLDMTPPAILVDAPALTNDSTPTITGTTNLAPGSTVTLVVTGANGAAQSFSATVQTGGTYSADVPAALVEGGFDVVASATDPAGNSASATDGGVLDLSAPTLTVDAPALTNDSTPAITGTTDLPAGSTVTLSVTGADGAVQTFAATVQAGGAYSADVPAALVEGTYSVVASASDAAGNSASASDSGNIDLTAPALTVHAPTLGNDSTPTITGTTDLPAGSTVTLTVTDANGAIQTFSATVQAGGAYGADVPAALAEGAYGVVASGSDGAGNSATANDSGAIDLTPPAASITVDAVTADNVVNAGEAGATITLTGTVGGDVQPGNTVTLSVNGTVYSGLVQAGSTFAIAVAGSDVLADADRRIDASVTTTDTAGNSSTATAVRDYAVNTAPVAVADTLVLGEDAAAGAGDVTPGSMGQDSDADGDTLTVTGVAVGALPSAAGNVAAPLAGTWGTLTLNVDGSYSYVPAAAAQSLDAGQTVTDTFTYAIDDGRGGSATATLTISVVGADDPTTIAGSFSGSVQEDAVATASGALSAADPDVGSRSFVVQSGTPGAYGSFSIDATGNWSYSLANAAANVQALAQGQSVTETFVVTADDGTTASITVTVNGSNDAPVVSSTAINAVEEGTAVALGLAVPNDVDTAAVLTITVTGLPTIGQVQLADGTPVANGAALGAAQLAGLRYLPPADHDGVAPVGSFSYSVSDGLASVSGGTSITLATVNDVPVAGDASAGTGENAVLNASVPAAADVDGTIAGYALVSGVGAGNGSLTFNPDGSYIFNPGSDFDTLAAGATRQVSFTYTATDNDGAVSAPATVTITVTGTDDAPVISLGTGSVTEDSSPSASGTLTASDADNPALAFVAGTQGGAYGSLVLDAAGAWTYTLGAAAQAIAGGQVVSETFTVSLNDGSTTTVTITVTGTDDAPVISSGAGAVTEDTSPTASGTLTAGDVDNPSLAFVASTQTGAYGSLVLSAAGAWTYTLGAAAQALSGGQVVTESFTINLSDGSTTSVVITVTGTDDAPVISSGTGAVTEDTSPTVGGALTANDADNPSLAFVASTQAGAYGSLVLNAAGTWTYTLGAATQALAGGQIVTEAFTVTLTDGSTSTITITVTGTDDAPVISSGIGSVVEDSSPAASGALTATDADNPALAFVAGSQPGAYGSLVVNAAGAWTYTLGAAAQALAGGQVVSETFTVALNDGSTTTVTITVTGTNDVPVISSGAGAVTEDSSPSAAGTLTATDADNPGLAFVASTQTGAYGSLVLTAAGSWTYTLGAAAQALAGGQVVSETFTVNLNDGSATTVVITVTGTDDAPVISSGAGAVTEDSSPLASGSLTATDVDNPSLAFVASTQAGAYGSLVLDAAGSWTYTLDAAAQALAGGQVVTETFTVSLNDGSTTTVTITVTGTNDAPVISSGTGAVTEDASPTASGTLTATDADNPSLAFVASTQAGAYGSLVLNATGAWTYALGAAAQALAGGQVMTETFTVSLNDGSTTSVTITVTGTNDMPVISSGAGAVTEDTSPVASGTLTATDVDNPALAFVVSTQSGAYGSLVLNAAGEWTYTLGAAAQALGDGQVVTETFTVNLNDGSTTAVVITVTGTNDVPVVSSGSGAVTEDTSPAASGTLSATDVDNPALAFVAGTQAGAYGSLVLNAAGAWTYTLGAAAQALSGGQVVTETFTVALNDGSTTAVVITVTGTNDAPVISSGIGSVIEDTSPSTGGTLTATDVDNPSLAFMAGTQSGSYGSLVLNAAGAWTYTLGAAAQALDNGQVVTETFTVNLNDGSTTTVTITATGTNDGPVAVNDGSALTPALTVAEDSGPSAPIVVLANDSDADGDPLTVTAASSPNGTVTITPGNTLVFTPAANFNGPTTISYTVSDGQGGTSTATAFVDVTPVNDAPVNALPGAQVTGEDTALTFSPVNGNAISIGDIDAGMGGLLSVMLTATHGTLTLGSTAGVVVSGNGTTSVTLSGTQVAINAALSGTTFQPDANFNGSAMVVVVTGDNGNSGSGGTQFDTDAIPILVLPVNDAPAAANASAGTGENTVLNASVPAATDVDGTIASYALVTGVGAGNGTLSFNSSGAYTFTPGADFDSLAPGATRQVTFTYTATDNSGAVSAPATVTITVTGTNDAPVITSDGAGTTAAVSVAENSTAVTTVTATDVDAGQALGYSIVGGADAARFTIHPTTGALAFVTAPNFEAPTDANGDNVYVVQVQVDDGNGGTDLQTISVTVTDINEVPTIGSAAVTTTEDTTHVFAWADFAVSDDSAPVSQSIQITSLPADGALQYFDGTSWVAATVGQSLGQASIAAGNLRFVPDPNESGTDGYGGGVGNVQSDYAQFGYTASDGVNTSVGATMRIDVAPVADATTIAAAAAPLPTSVGLTRVMHDNVASLNAGGTGGSDAATTLATIERRVEAETTVTTATVTGITSGQVGSLANDDAYRVTGFVYLEAGRTYSFTGSYQDTLSLEIGGVQVFGAAHTDGAIGDTETVSGATYVAPASGYYSIEMITYSMVGGGGNSTPGFVDLSVSIDGAAALALDNTNFNLQTSAAAITGGAAAASFGELRSLTDPNNFASTGLSNAGFIAHRGGSAVQGQGVLLPVLSATYGDSADGSERHRITLDLGSAPVGTRVFVDANGDGAADDGRVFTVTAGNTLAVVYDEDNPAAAVGGSNWNLSAIRIDPPTTYSGSFTVNAIASADEMVGAGAIGSATSTQALTVTLVAASNLAPDVASTGASVSEEGLAGGLADSTGTVDTTDAASVSGTISISDAVDGVADSITSVTLTAPTTALTSGGVPVTWSGAGTGTLTGTAGGETVATLTINTAGAYTFNLLGGIDHPTAGIEDVLSINFGVVASDGVNTGSGTLTIDVEDDSPGTVAPIASAIAGTDTNLLIILDLSGSMDNASGIPGLTRLEAAIQSINTLLDRYDEFGAVAVRLVTFSDTATAQGASWMSVSAAKSLLATLSASGATDYDDAIAAAQTAFATTSGRLSDAQNVSYFLSDGAPTSGDEIGAVEETAWQNFLNSNLIRSFAIGMGAGVPQAQMNPIAFNGQSNENTNAVVVEAFDDLDNVLAGTIQTPPAGMLSGGASFATDGVMGGDGGGMVVSLTIEGTTYTFDAGANSVASSGGTDNGSFDAATSTLTVTTSHGGRFAVDMDDGSYRYSAPDAVPASFVESMAYTVADDDGDMTSSSVTVSVDKANTVIGTASSETLTGTAAPDYIVGRDGDDTLVGLGGNDVLQGNNGADNLSGGDGADRLAGGAGNDALDGGLGADTFEWKFADRGTAGSPAIDSVADFDAAVPAAGGDILDLRDLLQGETTSATLDRYLDFNVSGGTTTIRISSTGAFTGGTYASGSEDQRIVLSGVDIRASLGLAGSATDSQIISELINRGKLLTDVPAGS